MSDTKQTILLTITLCSMMVILVSFTSNRSNLWYASTVGDNLFDEEGGDFPPLPRPHAGLNFTWMSQHPIYQRFYMKAPIRKKSVDIILIVSSAPNRIERRAAIRRTWWTQCVKSKSVIPECVFLTDYQGPNDLYFHQVHNEKIQYGDLYFQLVKSGVMFGKRFINHMLFAETMYEYDYLLRVDDDQFLCLERLLLELPFPMEKHFHWGWVHKEFGGTRPDEALMLFSHDVIINFLMQEPSRMLCHPLADQMIAAWLTDLNITSLLKHDYRILHDVPVRHLPYLTYINNICRVFISIHGAYPNDMKNLWMNRGEHIRHVKGNLKTYSLRQLIQSPFQWSTFGRIWRYEPKLCMTNPVWDTRKLLRGSLWYKGRE